MTISAGSSGLDQLSTDPSVVPGLQGNKLIRGRVKRLMSIPGVGEVTAFDVGIANSRNIRFSSSRQAISYCGLCGGQHESAGKEEFVGYYLFSHSSYVKGLSSSCHPGLSGKCRARNSCGVARKVCRVISTRPHCPSIFTAFHA